MIGVKIYAVIKELALVIVFAHSFNFGLMLSTAIVLISSLLAEAFVS